MTFNYLFADNILTNRRQSLIVSYLTMRRLIGVIGIALPIIIVLGGFIQNEFVILDSISNYYYLYEKGIPYLRCRPDSNR